MEYISFMLVIVLIAVVIYYVNDRNSSSVYVKIVKSVRKDEKSISIYVNVYNSIATSIIINELFEMMHQVGVL